MNRHEVEERLRTLEAKVRFIMHTLALTRRNNSTGETDSRTLDTLFAEALKHEALQHTMDAAHLAQVVGESLRPDGSAPVDRTVSAPPRSDGDSGSQGDSDGSGESPECAPSSPD